MQSFIKQLFHKKLLIEILILALLIRILHELALDFYLYWITEWADMVMHTLGGLFIGLATLFVFFTSGYIHIPHHKRVIILFVIGMVLVVGLSWELWEIWFGLIDALRDRVDSLMDLGFDVLGGILSLMYYYYITDEES